MFLKCVFSVIVASQFSFAALAADKSLSGSEGGGGGDFASQEFYNLAHGLPDALVFKGLNLFPEVNIEKLRERVNNKALLKVESQAPIVVNGISKDAYNYWQRNLVQIDSNKWSELNKLPDAFLRKQALTFHEILGLMQLEGNDEYHISQRLYDTTVFRPVNVKGDLVGVGEFVASDLGSKSAILVEIFSDENRVFVHCGNRDYRDSCEMVGFRGYSLKELTSLNADLLRKEKWAKKISVGGPIALASAGAGGGFLVANAPGALAGGAAGLVVGLSPISLNASQAAEDCRNYAAPLNFVALKAGRVILPNVYEAAKALQQDLVWLN